MAVIQFDPCAIKLQMSEAIILYFFVDEDLEQL